MQRSLAHLNDEIDDLQREYDAIATSRTSRGRIHRLSFPKSATKDFFAIFESSPRKLLSALQIEDSPTVMERRAALDRTKGRSLLDTLEDLAVDRLGMEEDSCSVCSSSVVVQEIGEVSAGSCDGGKKVEVEVEEGGGGGGGGIFWIGLLLAVVIVLLVVVDVLAVGDNGGYGRYKEHLAPT